MSGAERKLASAERRLASVERRLASAEGQLADAGVGLTPAPPPERDVLEELEELEELYQHAPVGLCAVDLELRYVRANNEYAQIVGRSQRDLIGRSMREVIPASARDGAMAAAARVIESGEPSLGLELRRESVTDPQERRIWLANIHPIRRDGRIAGAMAVLQNITEVRRAEEAARARLEEIESIYRNAPVGLSLVDKDLRYLRVNQAIADLNGLAIEQVVGKTYRDLSPDTADRAEPLLYELMERGEPVRNLETISRPPADPDVDHHFLLNMEPLRNPQGEIVGHMAAVQDVTDLRRAEAAAAQRLSELEILYENTPVGLCYLSLELEIIHVNALFAAVCGRSVRRLRGVEVGPELPQKVAERLLPQLEYVRRRGVSSLPLEIRGAIPGEGERELTWVAQTHPTRPSGDEVTGLVTVLKDITSLTERRQEVEAIAARLSEAQQMASLGSFEWNLIDGDVWWSRELYVITGRPKSFVPSYEGFFDLVFREDRDKLREQIDATLADGSPVRSSFRIVRPDGSLREIFGVARVDRSDGGLPLRMVGTWQDVTEFGAPSRR